MRRAHILKRNKTCESPQHAVFVCLDVVAHRKRNSDTEYSFSRGCLLHWRRSGGPTRPRETYYAISNARDFWRLMDSLSRDKTRMYVVIENSNVTLTLLDVFTRAWKEGWTCSQAVIECPPTIIRWRKDRKSLHLVDVQNFWPKPLTSGCDGRKKPQNHDSEEEHSYQSVDARLRHDVEILKSSMTAWWDFLVKNDYGGFASTAGSQAVRTFRHRSMTHEILIDTNEKALKLARDAYAGGRTECWYIGKASGEFYLLDINSMYAAVMQAMRVPVRLRGYTEHASVDDVRRWSTDSVVIVDCELTTEEPAFHCRENASLIFPVGTFRTCLASEEVMYALDNARINKIYRAAVYDGAPAFHQYVTMLWRERRKAIEENDTQKAEQYKLLLVGFYGKWGQRGGQWEKVDDCDSALLRSWIDIDYHTRSVTEFRQFGGIIQARKNESESSESHPAIASSISANARIKLWSLMRTAGMENVYYVDTDSLLVNRVGLFRLQSRIDASALGGLRCQGMYNEITIHACKDYVLDNTVRCKGRARDAHVINDTTFEHYEMQSPATMIRRGDMSRAFSMRVRKQLHRKYDKGIIGDDKRITPIRKEIQ